jgi:hypothetical protein
MGNGERVQVQDGVYSLEAFQRSTFPSAKYCLILDIDGRSGLTSFLTSKEISSECTSVRIKNMEVAEMFWDEK